jgi:diacylglycerol kinase (ATP)
MRLPAKLKATLRRPIRAKLIFNPGSGQTLESPQQLVNILAEMQKQHILPEVFVVQPGCSLESVVQRALKSGIKLIVVAGGDGTIDSVAGAMVGQDATLGIIPTGTRNNVAFNLGITSDIADCVALLRDGHHLKIDVGRVHCGNSHHWFLEGVALGLISDLYPIADDFQHGDLTQIGGLLSTLVSAIPANLEINLDGKQHLATTAHMLLVANMSYIGPHFQISPDVSFKDGHLDVFTFSDMSKLNMISYALLSRGGLLVNEDIQHYRAKTIKIVSDPPMPVLADGTLLGQGLLSIHVHPRALRVMVGTALTGQPALKIADETRLEEKQLAADGV